MRARGKIIVVTGAGNGMGRALALTLLGQRPKVAASDVDDARLQQTATLASAAAELQLFRLEIADPVAVAGRPQQARQRLGPSMLLPRGDARLLNFPRLHPKLTTRPVLAQVRATLAKT